MCSKANQVLIAPWSSVVAGIVTIGPALLELETPDGWCAMTGEAVASSARPAYAEPRNALAGKLLTDDGTFGGVKDYRSARSGGKGRGMKSRGKGKDDGLD